MVPVFSQAVLSCVVLKYQLVTNNLVTHSCKRKQLLKYCPIIWGIYSTSHNQTPHMHTEFPHSGVIMDINIGWTRWLSFTTTVLSERKDTLGFSEMQTRCFRVDPALMDVDTISETPGKSDSSNFGSRARWPSPERSWNPLLFSLRTDQSVTICK